LSQLFNEKDEIPRGKMKELVKDLGKMKVRAVTFSGGGEPLCYPYIPETVEGFLKRGIKIAVLTNGSLLKGEISKILGRHATWVRVSMDAATAKSYSEIRKVSINEFSRVCGNISDFANMKDRSCELGVNFIVSRDNYRDVYIFLNLAKKLGVNHVKVCECVVSTKNEENKRYHSAIFNAINEQIAAGISELADAKFTIVDKFSNQHADNYDKNYALCPFIQCLTVIGADMNVYTCQDKAYTVGGKLGSIGNKRFSDFWFSTATQKKLKRLVPAYECSHHCTQDSKNKLLLDYINLKKTHLEFV
jgi:MoaA/NifB/PqqE/SkfB family radical SAM enzyme